MKYYVNFQNWLAKSGGFCIIRYQLMPKKEKETAEKTIITQVTHLEGEAPKRAYILFLSGPLIGKLFHLQDGCTTVGRATDADITVADPRISRHHSKIDVRTEDVTIEDLGSTNGTFVNGKRVSHHKLSDGDKIQISSSTVFKFALQDKTENIFHKELYKMAVVDPVTNVYNKRFFIERLKEEFSHSRRSKIPLAFLMIDIDFFKKVNDTHGHLAGDMLLHQLAKIMKDMIRNEDVLARYGGEEFAAILRGTNKTGAYNLAERIRQKVASTPLVFEEKKIPITISIGVAALDDGLKHDTQEEFIKDADEKLYQSKQNGRNKTTA